MAILKVSEFTLHVVPKSYLDHGVFFSDLELEFAPTGSFLT